MRPIVLIATVMPLVTLLACQGPTAPSVAELQLDRARWTGHHLTKYGYDYATSGFFNGLTGQTIHLVILGDTIRSAVVVATGENIPVPSASLSTIDGLFDQAIASRNAGTLTGVEFDPVLGYPRRIDFSGPPDAGGSFIASSLQPLP